MIGVFERICVCINVIVCAYMCVRSLCVLKVCILRAGSIGAEQVKFLSNHGQRGANNCRLVFFALKFKSDMFANSIT